LGSAVNGVVNADNQAWETDNLQFEIINTIDGVEALTKELPIILCGSAS
jgi:hypothetical protein